MNNLHPELADSRKFTKISPISLTTKSRVFKVRYSQDNNIYIAIISNNPSTFQNDFDEGDLHSILNFNHRNILPIRWITRTDFDNLPYPMVILDYTSDFTIDHFVFQHSSNRQNCMWDDTKKLMAIYGIADAMKFIHHSNVIHKYLNLNNIFVDSSMQPKLFDFGLSFIDRDSSNSKQTLTAIASNFAPEIITNSQYSKESDVYLFGILVYEILTSKLPYGNKSFNDVLYHVPQGLSPNLNESNISPCFQSLISRCLSSNPSERPTFDDIESELRENKNYISSSVNIEDYAKYINHIDDDSSQDFPYRNTSNSKSLLSLSPCKNSESQSSNLQIPTSCLFPRTEFNNLNDSCRKIVIDADNNPSKEYELALYLIEGHNNFPQNINLGFQYARLASFHKYHDATVYLCRQLIRGKIISRQLQEASAIIKQQDKNDPDFIFLHGYLKEKLKEMKKAKQYYKMAMEAGHAEATYKYGKMIFLGIGSLKDDQQTAVKYFTEAKNKGCDKGTDFLMKYNRKLQNQEISPRTLNDKLPPKRNSAFNSGKEFNVLVVGNSSEEKISLMVLLSGKEISKRGLPATFPDAIITKPINDLMRKFKVVNTSNDFSIPGHEVINCIILCFYLNSIESFNSLKDKWYPEAKNYFPLAKIVLVSLDNHSYANQVDSKDIEKFKSSAKISSYINCSLDNTHETDGIFNAITHVCGEKRKTSFWGF